MPQRAIDRRRGSLGGCGKREVGEGGNETPGVPALTTRRSGCRKVSCVGRKWGERDSEMRVKREYDNRRWLEDTVLDWYK